MITQHTMPHISCGENRVDLGANNRGDLGGENRGDLGGKNRVDISGDNMVYLDRENRIDYVGRVDLGGKRKFRCGE